MSRIERLSLQAKVALSTTSQSLGNLLIALGGVAVVRITTHQLGPRDYGTFALIVTYVTLFTMVADMGITAMTTIELGKSRADHSSVLSSALSFRLALSLILIPVIQVSAFILYPHETSLFRVALGVMSLDVFFATLQITSSTAFIARVRGDRIAALNVINRALYVLGVVIVAIKRGSYFDYICAYVRCRFRCRRPVHLGCQETDSSEVELGSQAMAADGAGRVAVGTDRRSSEASISRIDTISVSIICRNSS